MALVFFLFFTVFGSIVLAAVVKKHRPNLSWAWLSPRRVLASLASPAVQLALVLLMYLLLRAGHTRPQSAFIACLLTVGLFGTLSLVVRAALVTQAQVMAFLDRRPAPPVVEEEYVVQEHPDSVLFRAKQGRG